MTTVAKEKTTDKNHDNIKIGARILDDQVISNLLPNWANIEIEIEKFRDQAQKIHLNDIVLNSNDHEYYNVISILGNRGSGKTSILRTIRSKFRHTQDIILPLILPDKMGEVTDALGWIIKLLEIEMKDYLNTDENNHFLDECCKTSNNQLKKELNKLKFSYYKRINDYKNIITENYVGTKEFVNDKDDVLNSDIELLHNFRSFIQECINVKITNDPKTEPLLFIYFDDVDISAERCPEILKTIMCYLTHPNIVTFVSGDLQVFTEILTIHFLSKEEILNRDLMNIVYTNGDYDEASAINLRRKRSTEYLKKIMPPAFRYNLTNLSPRQKGNYRYNKERPTLFELITKEFAKKNTKSIVTYNPNSKLPYVFHSIFPDNPRSLINIYYYLYTRKGPWEYADFSGFLDILYESKDQFQKVRQYLTNYIYGIDQTWVIDYEYLDTLYENQDESSLYNAYEENKNIIAKKEQERIKGIINLITLGLFFKEIVNSIIPNSIKEKGSNYLFKYINKLSTSDEFSIAPIDDSSFLIHFYNSLSSRLIDSKLSKLFLSQYTELNTTYLNSLKETIELSNSDENSFVRRFEEWYYENKENRKWLEKIIVFIYTVNTTEETRLKGIIEKFNNNITQYNHSNKIITKKSFTSYKKIIVDTQNQNNSIILIEKEIEDLGNSFKELTEKITDVDYLEKTKIDEFEKHKELFQKYIHDKNNLKILNNKIETKTTSLNNIKIQLDIAKNQKQGSISSIRFLPKESFSLIQLYIDEYNIIVNNNKDIWNSLLEDKYIKYESCLTEKKKGTDSRNNEYEIISTFNTSESKEFRDILDKIPQLENHMSNAKGYLLQKKDINIDKSVESKIKEIFVYSEIMNILKLLKPNFYQEDELSNKKQSIHEDLSLLEDKIKISEEQITEIEEKLLKTVYRQHLKNEIKPSFIINKLKFLNSISVILEDIKIHSLHKSKHTYHYLKNNIIDLDTHVRSLLTESLSDKNITTQDIKLLLESFSSYLMDSNDDLFNRRIIRRLNSILRNLFTTNDKDLNVIINNLKLEAIESLKSEKFQPYFRNNRDEFIITRKIHRYNIQHYYEYLSFKGIQRVSFIENDYMEDVMEFYFTSFSNFFINISYLTEKEYSKKLINSELYDYRKKIDDYLKEKLSRGYINTGFVGFLKKLAN